MLGLIVVAALVGEPESQPVPLACKTDVMSFNVELDEAGSRVRVGFSDVWTPATFDANTVEFRTVSGTKRTWTLINRLTGAVNETFRDSADGTKLEMAGTCQALKKQF